MTNNVLSLGLPSYWTIDSSPADDGMSDDDFAFETVMPDKGKAKQKSFDVEAESMSPKDLEATMRKEAEYVASLFGADVSTLSFSADRPFPYIIMLTHVDILLSDIHWALSFETDYSISVYADQHRVCTPKESVMEQGTTR